MRRTAAVALLAIAGTVQCFAQEESESHIETVQAPSGTVPIKLAVPNLLVADKKWVAEHAHIAAAFDRSGTTIETSPLSVTVEFEHAEKIDLLSTSIDSYFDFQQKSYTRQYKQYGEQPKLTRWKPKGLDSSKLAFRALESEGDMSKSLAPERMLTFEVKDGFYTIAVHAFNAESLDLPQVLAVFERLGELNPGVILSPEEAKGNTRTVTARSQKSSNAIQFSLPDLFSNDPGAVLERPGAVAAYAVDGSAAKTPMMFSVLFVPRNEAKPDTRDIDHVFQVLRKASVAVSMGNVKDWTSPDIPNAFHYRAFEMYGGKLGSEINRQIVIDVGDGCYVLTIEASDRELIDGDITSAFLNSVRVVPAN